MESCQFSINFADYLIKALIEARASFRDIEQWHTIDHNSWRSEIHMSVSYERNVQEAPVQIQENIISAGHTTAKRELIT
ncbi:hypothetical protein AKJ16_DCAP10124 [Drosera capensis]